MPGSSTSRLPKLNGADIELGNFVLGSSSANSPGLASRALLAEIDGLPRERESYNPSYLSTSSHACGWSNGGQRREFGSNVIAVNPQDWGRKFLPTNGGCVYIDLDHLELCVPEVISAWDHVAAWQAMLSIARDAMNAANAKLPEGRSIQVLVNNSDGHGHSYGSHLNFLVNRQAWDNIFQRKPHHLAWLASFQVSSIVYTGQGKVGSENGAPAVPFQLSQRADYFETLVGPQTTHRRPIVNSREEHLCGGWRGSDEPNGPARLHVIFFDNTLAHRSCLLKVGVMQLILAMLEAGVVNPSLILDDPLAAVLTYSHDPTLRASARLAKGDEIAAVELQFLYLEEARRFAAEGGFEDIVPRADEILDLWQDTLGRLRESDWPTLAAQLDWVMKWMLLQRTVERRSDLSWESPEIRHLDQIYSSLGEDGLYWAFERSGCAERLVSEGRIEYFRSDPPPDTRAWTRAMLLRTADPEWVDRVDWDSISFRVRDGNYWPSNRRIELPDPLRFTAAELAEFLTPRGRFLDVLDAVEAAGEFEPRPVPVN